MEIVKNNKVLNNNKDRSNYYDYGYVTCKFDNYCH